MPNITDIATQLAQETEGVEVKEEPQKEEELKEEVKPEETPKEEVKEEPKQEEPAKEEDAMPEVASQRAQNRFQKLVNERNALREENEKLKAEQAEKPTPSEEEENKMIEERMAKLGYVKQTDLEKLKDDEERKVLVAQETQKLETELKTLKDQYGDTFDRNKVINYMKENGVLNPEAAFFATSYDKLKEQVKPKENRNVGYEGLAGTASGNTVNVGDTVSVGKPVTNSVSDIAKRLAAATLGK